MKGKATPEQIRATKKLIRALQKAGYKHIKLNKNALSVTGFFKEGKIKHEMST